MEKATKNLIYLLIVFIVTILYWFQSCLHADLSEGKCSDLLNLEMMYSRLPWLALSLILAMGLYCKDIYFDVIKLDESVEVPTPEQDSSKVITNIDISTSEEKE